MSSTLMRLMEVMQERYRGMSFSQQPGDYCGSIQPQNIVIWKSALAMKEGEATLPHVETPGLVITPPKTIRAPAEAGTNHQDDVFYAVMVQLIDTDGQERFEGLSSYTKWLQQIRRSSHARSWPEVEIARYGDVRQSFAEVTNTMDEKSWARHPKFLAGVAVVLTVREPRGIET
jgi:hypothetical protein